MPHFFLNSDDVKITFIFLLIQSVIEYNVKVDKIKYVVETVHLEQFIDNTYSPIFKYS